MHEIQADRRRLTVLAALSLLLLLAALFAVRVMARGVDAPVAPSATVRAPIAIDISEIPTPLCFGCPDNRNAPLGYQLDLDLLAPLGDGQGNAAEWFKDFAHKTGARRESAGRPGYAKRLVENTLQGKLWKVLPGDDPLLLEAEPWVDQAGCSFYPEIFELEGAATQIPDLLMLVDLARSWVWRGMHSDDPQSAREDFRRAIRLGRLMRQDDVTIIQNLVAVTCIRLGTEALYELARREGDAGTMLVTARVLADGNSFRQGTMSRLSSVDFMPHVQVDEDGTARLMLDDLKLGRMLGALREIPDRAIRMEGALGLQIVMHTGSAEQRERAAKELAAMTEDPDPVVADHARRMQALPFDVDALIGGSQN